MTQPKRIDIAEFRRLGLLQEVNRQFFHPLGLALSVQVDLDTGEAQLSGIWDYRDDPEGIRFGTELTSRPDWITDAEQVAQMQWDRYETRTKALGYWIQPVRICRVCGCTDDDCPECIERTGEPCSWVEGDLCSACVEAIG
jgi:hypothetical protein